MTIKEIYQLQDIVQGRTYNLAILNLAISQSTNFEATVLLKALKSCHSSFTSRMFLQTYICDLLQEVSK